MTKCLGTKSRMTRYPFIAFVGDQINSRINKCVSEGWPANSGQNWRHDTTVGHNGVFFLNCYLAIYKNVSFMKACWISAGYRNIYI